MKTFISGFIPSILYMKLKNDKYSPTVIKNAVILIQKARREWILLSHMSFPMRPLKIPRRRAYSLSTVFLPYPHSAGLVRHTVNLLSHINSLGSIHSEYGYIRFNLKLLKYRYKSTKLLHFQY
jgi:hypothetical protein